MSECGLAIRGNQRPSKAMSECGLAIRGNMKECSAVPEHLVHLLRVEIVQLPVSLA
jgi:hypothetical protein